MLAMIVAPTLLVAFGIHGLGRKDIGIAVAQTIALTALLWGSDPTTRRRIKAWMRKSNSN